MSENTENQEVVEPTNEAATAENTENNNEEKKEKGPATLALHQFYGQKAGMTRIFNDEGKHVPVTVIKLIPNYVTQVKTSETKDGYSAYQVGYYEKREKLVNKPTKGHLKKAGVAKNLTRFFEVKSTEAAADSLGKEIDYSAFTAGSFVDITSNTKGKGFQGVIKRYGFRGGPASHGSHFHRTTGSIGNRATPGRVFKLKKMPGHMGNKKRTIQNLQVVEVNTQEGYLLVKGSVPGHKNSFVKVQKAVKK